MFEVVCISFAFFFGLAVRQVGLPPMVGFLAAGFAVNLAGQPLGLPDETHEILKHVSHLGVLLLMFAVGLKLKLGQVAQPQVLGGGLLHFAITCLVLGGGLTLLAGLPPEQALLLAVALSFSSTVFSAKILEAKRDLGTFYGRTTIGVLIVQDLIALIVLALWAGQMPTIWALAVFALPLLRPLLFKLLDLTGHDELLVLMGMLLALVVGGMGFQAMGLSSEIGALVMGLMLSSHPRSKELSESLWGLKEIFLVGFFLQIGMSGLPGWSDLGWALAFLLLLPAKGILFFFILILFRLRARSAFLAALSLSAYSEFGLIVAAKALPEWIVPLALTVSLSFVLAAPFNNTAQSLFDRFEGWFQRFDPRRMHRDELPTNLGNAQIMVLGMGRTGSAAYDSLLVATNRVVGIDADTYRVRALRAEGRNALYADVEDAGFWRALDCSALKAVILAMDNVEAKEAAARSLRRKGFDGPIISHALYESHLERLRAAGATHTYLTMAQAGRGLADHAVRALDLEPLPDGSERSTKQGDAKA